MHPKLKMYLKNRGIKSIRKWFASRQGSAAYWAEHMVVEETFPDVAASMDHFLWRNAQYPGYIELMPVTGADGLVVMDYGCGPGNDLIGFCEFSKPAKVYGVDVSSTALQAAERRLRLHEKSVELVQINEDQTAIPLDSESIDLVHSSGVLHHVKEFRPVIRELHRVLKKGATLQIMVYNYYSIWLHLYIAYLYQIEQGLYSDLPLLDAFRRTTDGQHCPISRCYKPEIFTEEINGMGFEGGFKGAAISLTELMALPKRFEAIKNRNLAQEHRDFLSALKFNEYDRPTYKGNVAGIDGCYSFKKI